MSHLARFHRPAVKTIQVLISILIGEEETFITGYPFIHYRGSCIATRFGRVGQNCCPFGFRIDINNICIGTVGIFQSQQHQTFSVRLPAYIAPGITKIRFILANQFICTGLQVENTQFIQSFFILGKSRHISDLCFIRVKIPGINIRYTCQFFRFRGKKIAPVDIDDLFVVLIPDPIDIPVFLIIDRLPAITFREVEIDNIGCLRQVVFLCYIQPLQLILVGGFKKE